VSSSTSRHLVSTMNLQLSQYFSQLHVVSLSIVQECSVCKQHRCRAGSPRKAIDLCGQCVSLKILSWKQAICARHKSCIMTSLLFSTHIHLSVGLGPARRSSKDFGAKKQNVSSRLRCFSSKIIWPESGLVVRRVPFPKDFTVPAGGHPIEGEQAFSCLLPEPLISCRRKGSI
jgi:hypothetical protein